MLIVGKSKETYTRANKKLLQFTLDDGSDTDHTILSGIHAFYEPEELMEKPMSSFFRENHETVFNAN